MESRVKFLNEDKKQEYREKVDAKRNELEAKFRKKHTKKIKKQIRADEEELNDFNIVICSFERGDTDYQFLRTEPLFHEGEKNFDVLLGSQEKGILVFVECERTLIEKLSKKITDFIEQRKVIEENSSWNVDIGEYLSKTLNRPIDEKDFVISSKKMSDQKLNKEAKEREINLTAWNLSFTGPSCTIHSLVIKKNLEAPYKGYADEEMKTYLEDVLSSGVKFVEVIDFTYSSSRFLKIRNMIIAIMNRFQRKDKYFDFPNWKDLFEDELSNYKESEKKAIFSKFIKYGKDCGLIALAINKENKFKNEFRIKTRASKRMDKLENEIYEKMASYEMQKEVEENLKEMKKEILNRLIREQATGGSELTEFNSED